MKRGCKESPLVSVEGRNVQGRGPEPGGGAPRAIGRGRAVRSWSGMYGFTSVSRLMMRRNEDWMRLGAGARGVRGQEAGVGGGKEGWNHEGQTMGWK